MGVSLRERMNDFTLKVCVTCAVCVGILLYCYSVQLRHFLNIFFNIFLLLIKFILLSFVVAVVVNISVAAADVQQTVGLKNKDGFPF